MSEKIWRGCPSASRRKSQPDDPNSGENYEIPGTLMLRISCCKKRRALRP